MRNYSYQLFLNLPFGANERKSHAVFLEVCERSSFAEQRRSGTFSTAYKFNDYGEKSFEKAFDEHSAQSAELDSEIEERDSPMPLKINNKTYRQTGLYYYGARYYNPRTSVFISVDPLAEQTMAPYQYTYQNPVRYTDPDGKAPYDHIFTWKNGKLTMYDNKNGSSHIYVNGVLMSDLNLTQSSNRKIVRSIATYYANKIGIKSEVNGGRGNIKLSTTLSTDNSEDNPAFTYGNDIYLNIKDYTIACYFSDYNNLMSALEHEGFHKERKQGFEATRGTSLEHAQVYTDQIQSNIFNNTTKEFQDGMIESFTNYLNTANKELGIGEKQDNLMKSVNKKLKSMNSNQRVGTMLGSGAYYVYEIEK